MARPVDARRELLAESKKRSKRRRTIFGFVLFFLSIFLIISFFYVLHLDTFRVKEVIILGNSAVEASAIKTNVEKNISGSFLFLIPKNISFILNKEKIGMKVLAEFSNISQVEVDLEGFSKLIVKVKEREQKLVWCNISTKNEEVENKKETCWYTDKTGVIFGRAPTFSDGIILKLSGLVEINDSLLGTRVLPAEDFTKLLHYEESLTKVVQASGIGPFKVSSLTLEDYGDVRLVFIGGVNSQSASTTLPSSWSLLFNRDQSLSDLIKNFSTVVSAPEFESDLVENKNLDYLDLRFGKKVFYKFKQ